MGIAIGMTAEIVNYVIKPVIQYTVHTVALITLIAPIVKHACYKASYTIYIL